MGIAADLDVKNDDNTSKTPESSATLQTKKASSKRPATQPNTLSKDKKAKTVNGKQSSSPVDNIKMLEKQKKKASLESSKLMAASLLKGTKTDKEFQPSNSFSTPINVSTAVSTHTTVPFSASFTQPQSSLQQVSASSSTSVPYTHHSSVIMPSAVSSPSSSSCIPHYPTPKTQETLTGTHNSHISFQQQNMVSSIHSPSQTPLPTDDIYQPTVYLYDWDYSGSASELIANTFTNEEGRGFSPSMDCFKRMPLIHALTQCINTLEEKVESLLTSNKHSNKYLTPAASNASPPTSAPSSFTTPATLNSALSTPQTSRSATPNQSLSSVADLACTDNEDGSMNLELLPGYGVKITLPQLDACLRKSKGSGTALARLLVNVYFDDKTLAGSSLRGTKNKPALDTNITSAIINYVCSKRNCAERDIVQAINQKCADARATSIASCKKR